jgi:hypothetical protein
MNAAQLASYGHDGFLALPDFLSAAERDALSANRPSRPRHAYALHLIDGRATYSVDNWLQRLEFPLRGFS